MAERRSIKEFVHDLENRISELEREVINTVGSSQQARSDCPSSPTDLISFEPRTPPRRVPVQQFDLMETPTMFDPFNPYGSPPKPWTGQQMYVMDKLEKQRIKKEREYQLLQEKEFGQEMDISYNRQNLQDAINIFDPLEVCQPDDFQHDDHNCYLPSDVSQHCPPADDVYSKPYEACQPDSSRVPPCPTIPRVSHCPPSHDTVSSTTCSSLSPQPTLSPGPYNDFPSGTQWGENGHPSERKPLYSYRDSPALDEELLPPEALASVGGSNFLVEGMDDLPLYFNPLDAPRPGPPGSSRRADTQQLLSRARQLISKYKPQPSVSENCPPSPCPPTLQRQAPPQTQPSPQRHRSPQNLPSPPPQPPQSASQSHRTTPSGIAKISGLKQPTTTAPQPRCIPQLTPTSHTAVPGIVRTPGKPQTKTTPRVSGLPQPSFRAGTSGRTGIPGAARTLVAQSTSGAAARVGRGSIGGRGGKGSTGGRFGRGAAPDSTRGDPCYDVKPDYSFVRPEPVADEALQPRRLDQQILLETVAQIIEDAQQRLEDVLRKNLS